MSNKELAPFKQGATYLLRDLSRAPIVTGLMAAVGMTADKLTYLTISNELSVKDGAIVYAVPRRLRKEVQVYQVTLVGVSERELYRRVDNKG